MVLQCTVVTHLSWGDGTLSFPLTHATFCGNENGFCVPISSALGIAREIRTEGYSAGAKCFLFQYSDAGT